MRLLLVICVLAVVVSAQSASHRAEQQRQANEKQEGGADTPKATEAPLASKSSQGSKPRSAVEAASAHTEESYWYRAVRPETFADWAVVLVGLLAAWAAIRSLKALEQQAALGGDTLSLGAKNAVAAIESAAAAHLSAEYLKNAERAWIMAELLDVPGYGSGVMTGESVEDGQRTWTITVSVRLRCWNEGKTPAWVTEKRMGILVTANPARNPPLDQADYVQVEPEPVTPGKDSKNDYSPTIHLPRPKQDGELVVLFGVVRYRDIFDEIRETTFGYSISLYGGTRKRLFAHTHPEYNKNT